MVRFPHDQKQCGPDTCGGSCGTCPTGQACSAQGTCEPEPCEAQCTDRDCGPDSCGGTCGSCASDQVCSTQGTCEPKPCEPQCGGKDCGPDSCGGECGTCSDQELCSSQGICEPKPCEPQCDGKSCGPDSCGGECGSCASGSLCSSTGVCEPQQLSINCAAGQLCQILERTAWQYECKQNPDESFSCVKTGQIGNYPSYNMCRIGCAGGNSTCGETHGNLDGPTVACLTCVEGCETGTWSMCPQEVAGGCLYGGYQVACVCK